MASDKASGEIITPDMNVDTASCCTDSMVPALEDCGMEAFSHGQTSVPVKCLPQWHSPALEPQSLVDDVQTKSGGGGLLLVYFFEPRDA